MTECELYRALTYSAMYLPETIQDGTERQAIFPAGREVVNRHTSVAASKPIEHKHDQLCHNDLSYL